MELSELLQADKARIATAVIAGALLTSALASCTEAPVPKSHTVSLEHTVPGDSPKPSSSTAHTLTGNTTPSTIEGPSTIPTLSPSPNGGLTIVPNANMTPVEKPSLSCLEPEASNTSAHKLACQKLEAGPVAIVDFGAPSPAYEYNINQLATQAVARISKATGGLINPQVVVMSASAAAENQLRTTLTRNADGNVCLTPASPPQSPNGGGYAPLATIAANAMPELAPYTEIVAVGSESCTNGNSGDEVGGSTDPTSDRADVYIGNYAVTQANLTNVLSANLTHEAFGHMYGLGHAGTIEGCTASPAGYVMNVVNVATYFTAPCQYDQVSQYGDIGNIMSKAPADTTAVAGELFNPIQLDFLQQVATQVNPHSRGQALQEGMSVPLSGAPDSTQTYATLPIPSGFAGPETNMSIFTRLDFVATNVEDINGSKVPGIELMVNTPFLPKTGAAFYDRLMRTAVLDTFPITYGQRTFIVGNEQVTVSVLPDGTMQATLGNPSQ